jgi:hypothetical protein
MDFGHYDVLRPFGYFTTLHIGFTAFLSSYISGRTERTALHLVNRRRILELQDAVDAIVSSAEGLSLQDRVDILAGSAMCSATAAMSVVVAECKALYYRAPRPVVLLRPPIDVCRPRFASDSAYLALTLCVFPKHCGYLESYEMDQGVRLVKAGLLVDEYEAFESRVARWYGDVIPNPVMTLTDNLRYSILARLRRLSLSFVPVGSRDKPFFHVLSGVRRLCRAGGSCYRAAMMDPLRPRAMELRSRAIELLPPV